MSKQSLIPCLRYADAPAAMEFLCVAFGFERHAVYGDDGDPFTACGYCVIDDPDAHFERARAAGADIVTAPHANEGYPGRRCNARDPEGNDWDFGTYDPWAA